MPRRPASTRAERSAIRVRTHPRATACSLRDAAITRASRAASARAVLRPMPRPAPVTSATRPFTERRGSHVPARVDHDLVSGDVARALRDQEADRAGDVDVVHEAAERGLAGEGIVDGLGGAADLAGLLADDRVHSCAVRHMRADGVDRDLVRAELERQGAGEPAYGPLRRRVCDPVAVAAEAGRTGDVHDPAA